MERFLSFMKFIMAVDVLFKMKFIADIISITMRIITPRAIKFEYKRAKRKHEERVHRKIKIAKDCWSQNHNMSLKAITVL